MVLFNLANNYSMLNDNLKAIEYYNKTFETKGGDVFYIDYNDKFNLFDIGQNFDVSGKEIYFQRGISYLEIDSIKQSLSDLKNSIKRQYKVAESHYYIGVNYLKIRQDSLGCLNLQISNSMGNNDALELLNEYCN